MSLPVWKHSRFFYFKFILKVFVLSFGNIQTNSISHINSLLSMHNTARGSCAGLVTVGPTKVKACKSVLFTVGIPEVKIKIISQF